MSEFSADRQLELDFSYELLRTPDEISLLTPDELFEIADEHLIRTIAEDRRFEAKPNTFTPRETGEYACMWANTPPDGGIIALGIRNDSIFEGFSGIPQAKINTLEKCIDQFCGGVIWASKRVRMQRDADQGDDFVILLRVHYLKNRVARTGAGKVFVRKGDACKELKNHEEIRYLQIEKGEVAFEEEPISLEYPEDFDSQLVESFVETVREKKEWPETHNAIEILELMHLGSVIDGKLVPNVACALMFANDPRKVVTGCRVRFLRFEGEQEGTGEKWNATKDTFIDGTVPQQIQKTADTLRTQLRTFSRLGTDRKFFTTTEYPEVAWYEAVVNACVHRSYSNGLGNSPIFVKMFDDRLSVESPGGFPAFVNAENIYYSHRPRNPFLMDAMYYLKFVKCAHEGTRRIRDTMARMSLPEPEFSQKELGHQEVRATLRNNIQQRRVWVDKDVTTVVGEALAALLSEDEKRCLNHVAEHGEITVTEAQKLIGRTWGTAKKLLVRLTDRGILTHIHRTDLLRDPNAKFVLRKPNQTPKR